MKDLLKIRNELKKKKPEFIRQDAHKKPKLGSKWRKPKGSDSKMRVGFRGYRRSVTKGFKSPAAVKGMSRDGKKIVWVDNISSLKPVDAGKECIVISSAVGQKKKLDIVKAAIDAKISILNLKDPKGYIEDVKKAIEKKKEMKKEQKKQKEKKQKEKEEAAKKKEESEKEAEKEAEAKTIDDLADDEKKTQEKKEKDKLLIKKTS